MWEIDSSLQILNFARSALLGLLLCLGYDVFRSARQTVRFSRVGIALQDIIFSLLAAIVTFLFLLGITGGQLRGFVAIGIGGGFLLCRFTLSRVFLKLLSLLLGGIKLGISWFSAVFYRLFDRMEANILKIFKKSGKTLKKLLKRVKVLLYTKGNRKNQEQVL